MTDTTVRVRSETRQRLKVYASMRGLTQDEALWELLEEADVPEPDTPK